MFYFVWLSLVGVVCGCLVFVFVGFCVSVTSFWGLLYYFPGYCWDLLLSWVFVDLILLFWVLLVVHGFSFGFAWF